MNKYPLKKSEIIKILNKISIKNIHSEKIELSKSEGRILSSNITSLINLPPFTNSAVDGYAVHKNNLNKNKNIKCLKRIIAGDQKKFSIKINESARIFTGARMPKNSSTVVMQENIIKLKNNFIKIRKIPKEGENCRLVGEDIAKGQIILNSGEKINSQNINLIAAIGKTHVYVKNKLKIGYFTSGNELTKPSEKLKNNQINNSNLFSLKSLLNHNYIFSKYLGNLKDSKNEIIKLIIKNTNKYNIIITTGGASVGEEDYLIDVLKEKGKIFFWKTAIKPGRPLAIGKINDTIIICLPGNPVSVHLLYGMIIRPFIEFLCGSKLIMPKKIKVYANFTMKKKTERMEWLRVKLEKKNSSKICVYKYPKQGSGMISSIAYSDGIIEIPENVSQISKGDVFDLYLFDQLFN